MGPGEGSAHRQEKDGEGSGCSARRSPQNQPRPAGVQHVADKNPKSRQSMLAAMLQPSTSTHSVHASPQGGCIWVNQQPRGLAEHPAPPPRPQAVPKNQDQHHHGGVPARPLLASHSPFQHPHQPCRPSAPRGWLIPPPRRGPRSQSHLRGQAEGAGQLLAPPRPPGTARGVASPHPGASTGGPRALPKTPSYSPAPLVTAPATR